MAQDSETFNKDLYDLLKVRGYQPVPLNDQNQRVPASQEADVMEFSFNKDGKDYGKAWISVEDASQIVVYFSEEQRKSPNAPTAGADFDDTWTGLLKHLKTWAQRRQLGFELANKDRLGDDMKQRQYYKQKAKVQESYHPVNKKTTYSDAVPAVKIILQHSRSLEEGEQRYRNVARIFLENVDGERFLAPTTKPGLAKVYARHIAEGGLPNDDKWNHIKNICEEYAKLGSFVRATRNKEFNESAMQLIENGIEHYQDLRKTLSRMTSHNGYHTYFEGWTPMLMEDDLDESINDLFVQEMIDPRIESAMPILAKLRGKSSNTAVESLAEWAEDIINEKLELSENDEETLEETPVLGNGMSPEARARDVEQSDKEYIVQRQFKDNWKKENPGQKWPGYAKAGFKSETQLNELSADTVERYVDKADKQAMQAHNIARATGRRGAGAGAEQHFKKRSRGLGNAAKKLGGQARVPATEDLDSDQKKAGQLGPTEKISNKGVVGKLVGESEDLNLITRLAGIKNNKNG